MQGRYEMVGVETASMQKRKCVMQACELPEEKQVRHQGRRQ